MKHCPKDIILNKSLDATLCFATKLQRRNQRQQILCNEANRTQVYQWTQQDTNRHARALSLSHTHTITESAQSSKNISAFPHPVRQMD